MPTVLGPFKEFPGASHSFRAQSLWARFTVGKAWSVYFIQALLERKRWRRDTVQVTVSTTAERPMAVAIPGQKPAKQTASRDPLSPH